MALDVEAPELGPLPAVRRARLRPMSASRSAVLRALEADGPLLLADVAHTCGLASSTVREHLDALVRRGLAARVRRAPHGRGHPAWLYVAVPPAKYLADCDYAELAAALADSACCGPDAGVSVARAAGAEWGRQVVARVGADAGGLAPAAAVVRFLDQAGFAPEPGAPVRLTRCPLLSTARRHGDVVCAVHLGLVAALLDGWGARGDEVRLEPFAVPGACLLHLTPE